MNEIFNGYHGTCNKNIDAIFKNGFTSRKNDKHYLGQGIYFYTEKRIADWWARMQTKQDWNKGNLATTIKSTISVPKERILNMDDLDSRDVFSQYANCLFRKRLLKTNKNVSIKLKLNDPFIFRCLVFDFYKKEKNIGVIICTFMHKNSLGIKCVRSLGLPNLEKQICVTDNTYIIDKQIVYIENEVI